MDPADPGAAVALPDPALIVLVGPSGSGKSVWAAEHYRPDEVVSSDRLRALVGSGEHDLDASADAFALLDLIVAARLRRGLTAVVDTLTALVTGLGPRASYAVAVFPDPHFANAASCESNNPSAACVPCAPGVPIFPGIPGVSVLRGDAPAGTHRADGQRHQRAARDAP